MIIPVKIPVKLVLKAASPLINCVLKFDDQINKKGFRLVFLSLEPIRTCMVFILLCISGICFTLFLLTLLTTLLRFNFDSLMIDAVFKLASTSIFFLVLAAIAGVVRLKDKDQYQQIKIGRVLRLRELMR